MDKQSKETVFKAMLVATVDNTYYENKRSEEYNKVISRLEELYDEGRDITVLPDESDPRYLEIYNLHRRLDELSNDNNRIHQLVDELEGKLLEWMDKGSVTIKYKKVGKSEYLVKIYRNGNGIRFNLYNLEDGFVEEEYDRYLSLEFHYKWVRYYSRIGDREKVKELTR